MNCRYVAVSINQGILLVGVLIRRAPSKWVRAPFKGFGVDIRQV